MMQARVFTFSEGIGPRVELASQLAGQARWQCSDGVYEIACRVPRPRNGELFGSRQKAISSGRPMGASGNGGSQILADRFMHSTKSPL